MRYHPEVDEVNGRGFPSGPCLASPVFFPMSLPRCHSTSESYWGPRHMCWNCTNWGVALCVCRDHSRSLYGIVLLVCLLPTQVGRLPGGEKNGAGHHHSCSHPRNAGTTTCELHEADGHLHVAGVYSSE